MQRSVCSFLDPSFGVSKEIVRIERSHHGTQESDAGQTSGFLQIEYIKC